MTESFSEALYYVNNIVSGVLVLTNEIHRVLCFNFIRGFLFWRNIDLDFFVLIFNFAKIAKINTNLVPAKIWYR